MTKKLSLSLLCIILLVLCSSCSTTTAEKDITMERATAFVKQNLIQILEKDEQLFSILIDNNTILPHSFVKKLFKGGKEQWEKNFPEYTGLTEDAVNRLRGVKIEAPQKLKFRKMVGGTEKKPIFKSIPGSKQLFAISIRVKGKIKSMWFKLFLVKNKLYWEPAGW